MKKTKEKIIPKYFDFEFHYRAGIARKNSLQNQSDNYRLLIENEQDNIDRGCYKYNPIARHFANKRVALMKSAHWDVEHDLRGIACRLAHAKKDLAKRKAEYEAL